MKPSGNAPQPGADPVLPAVSGGPLPPPTATSTHDVVVIGASAGGVRALSTLLGALPADLPAAVFVTLHFSPESRSQLPNVIGRAAALPVRWAEDGDVLMTHEVRVAAADQHLLIEPGRMRVVHGPRENRHRPAIDPMFRSAAWAYGPRVVGVVLTGYLDDGTAGLWAIKSCGGTTVVQDPGDAQHPDMPTNALINNRVDHQLPLADIPGLLARLATEAAGDSPPRPESLKLEIGYAALNTGIRDMSRLGTLSPFTCPACRGALWEQDEGGHLRYRCHTGHAYSHASLVLEQGTEIEHSLYAALRVVEEKATALRRLAERWAGRFPRMKDDYENRAQAMDHTAENLRTMLAGGVPPARGGMAPD